MPQMNQKKNRIAFLPALAVFALACFIRHFKGSMSSYNTTLFALSYDYGFIPHGFIGSIFKFLGDILPYEISNYLGVYNFSGLFTLIYYIMLFWFYKVCMDCCVKEHKRNLQHLIVFLSIFAFTMWTTTINFGRLDIYLFIFTIICIVLIIKEKLEWLIIPLGIICTCIDQGFVFSNANTIVALLLYKIFSTDTKKIKKYLLILVLFFLSISALFLYFDSFIYVNGEEIFEEVKIIAKTFSESGKTYNKTFLQRELLSLDLTEIELEYHIDNAQDYPVFCILFAPYIFFGFRFFIKLILDKTAALKKRFVYMVALLGGATMLPQFLMGIDYGKYMFNLIFYYVSLLIAMLAMQDNLVADHLNKLKLELKKLTPLTLIWYLYPLLLTPFRAVAISSPIHKLAEILADPEISFFLQPK